MNKFNFKSLVAALLTVVMVFSIVPMFAVSAEEPAATIDFSTTDSRTDLSEDQQIWKSGDLTVTNEKAASTQPVKDYCNPARFYAHTSLTIAFPGMTKLEVLIPTAAYAEVWEASYTDGNATFAISESSPTDNASDRLLTVTFSTPVDSFTMPDLTKQTRMRTLSVYADAAEEPVVPTEATLDLTTTDNRTVFTTEQQVWQQNGITLTNDKASSTSNVADYSNPARFYKGSSLKIEYPGMTKIVATSSVAMYAKSLAQSVTQSNANATATYEDAVVTIVFETPVDSLFIETLSAQTRIKDLTVYTTSGSEGGETPDTPDTPDTPVVPATLAEQIAAAGALANKEYLPYDSTITGTITDAPQASSYTEGQYKFTVSDGTNTLLCYYVPVTGGTPAKGDTVTVTGKLTAFNGSAQFDSTAAATITKKGEAETPDTPDTPDTPTDTVVTAPKAGVAYKFGMVQGNLNNKIYYLKGGMNGYYLDTTADVESAIDVFLEETDGGYYLYTMVDGVKTYINMVVSGTHVNGAYETTASTVYTWNAEKNTITAVVNGEDYWHGTRNDKTYTTAGPVKVSYNGFYCQFYPVATDTPVEPPKPQDPAANTELSIKDALALGASKDHNTYTEGKYYVVGEIVEVYNTQYGNMKIKDAEGNILTIYGTYSADGSTRYDALETKPVAGDTVKIYGIVGQFNDTPQIKNGWIVEHTPAVCEHKNTEVVGAKDATFTEEGYTGDTVCQDCGATIATGETIPVKTPEASDGDTVAAPEAGVPYKFGMVQGNVGKTFYLKGGMDGYYMATSDNIDDAIDVYLEETEGGYYLYTMVDGVKTYINMVVSGTHVNGAYEATASTVYTWDAEHGTLISVVNDKDYWFGTRNDKTYTTVGPCATSYNGFYCQFYPSDTVIEPVPTGDGMIVVVASVLLAGAAIALISRKRRFN